MFLVKHGWLGGGGPVKNLYYSNEYRRRRLDPWRGRAWTKLGWNFVAKNFG